MKKRNVLQPEEPKMAAPATRFWEIGVCSILVAFLMHAGVVVERSIRYDVVVGYSNSESLAGSGMRGARKVTKNSPASPPPIVLLHQILPPNHSKYDDWIQSWDGLTNVRRKVYGDDDLLQVIEALNSTKLLQGWSAMERRIEQVDFCRYAILYLYGGMYADADQELSDPKSLEEGYATSSKTNTVLLPFEKGGLWDAEQVGQALMISPTPRQPFWWELMEYMVEHYNSTCNVLLNTGPLAMTRFWNEHRHKPIIRNDVRLSRLLDGGIDLPKYNRSVTIHHSSGSWINNAEQEKEMQGCRDRIPFHCDGCDTLAME